MKEKKYGKLKSHSTRLYGIAGFLEWAPNFYNIVF